MNLWRYNYSIARGAGAGPGNVREASNEPVSFVWPASINYLVEINISFLVFISKWSDTLKYISIAMNNFYIYKNSTWRPTAQV